MLYQKTLWVMRACTLSKGGILGSLPCRSCPYWISVRGYSWAPTTRSLPPLSSSVFEICTFSSLVFLNKPSSTPFVSHLAHVEMRAEPSYKAFISLCGVMTGCCTKHLKQAIPPTDVRMNLSPLHAWPLCFSTYYTTDRWRRSHRYLRCNGDREYIPGVAGRLGYRAEYEEASRYHLIPCHQLIKGFGRLL